MAGDSQQDRALNATTAQPTRQAPKTFDCPSCAAPIPLRALGQTVSVVCGSCNAVVDPRNESLSIISAARKAKKYKPRIKLGTRGKIMDELWEVVGFMRRSDSTEEFQWNEYLLFNPRKGYRWLVEDHGHWNFVTTLKSNPELKKSFSRESATYLDRKYDLYSSNGIKVLYVEGEFYWQVSFDEKSDAKDFISPPEILSCETTPTEVIWSRGIYLDPKIVNEAFQIESKGFDGPRGVSPNQPSPYNENWKRIRNFWFLLCLTLILTHCYVVKRSQNATIMQQTFTLTPSTNNFVSEPFNLKGPSSPVEFSLGAPLANNWLELQIDLVNDGDGKTYEFSKTLEYYSGTDSDGGWSEGSPFAEVELASIPSGTYHLNIDSATSKPGEFGTSSVENVDFTIGIKRDTPKSLGFWLSLIFISLPPIVYWLFRKNFEMERWSNSDYSPYE